MQNQHNHNETLDHGRQRSSIHGRLRLGAGWPLTLLIALAFLAVLPASTAVAFDQHITLLPHFRDDGAAPAKPEPDGSIEPDNTRDTGQSGNGNFPRIQDSRGRTAGGSEHRAGDHSSNPQIQVIIPY